jgi:2-dehydropantoate 2-reductase
VVTDGRQMIAVVGLGSIGGIVAASLRAADRHDVVACMRQPIERLTLERGDETVEVALRALTDPAQAKPVPWVLLCTKVHHTQSVAPWLAKLCDTHTRVAVLQNGIGHAERLAPYVNGAKVVPIIVYYNGERLAPDRVRFRRAGDHDLVVPDDKDGRDFAALLDGTQMRILFSDDFHTLAWRKLLINAAANPITALTQQRQAVLRRPDVKELCLALLAEADAVARADGARLRADESAQIMATLMTYPPEAGTSRYFDRVAGRPLEIEAITGAVVAAAERHKLPVPLNRALLTLLRAVNANGTEGQAAPGG